MYGKQTDIHSRYTSRYVELLEEYNDNIRNINIIKQKLKQKFFYIVMGILIVLTCAFVFTVIYLLCNFFKMTQGDKVNVELIISSSVSVISSFLTMIVALNKLPKIIAQYLFDSDEDKNMTKIIKNIQNYEISMKEKEESWETIMMNINNEGKQSEEQKTEDLEKGAVPIPENRQEDSFKSK